MHAMHSYICVHTMHMHVVRHAAGTAEERKAALVEDRQREHAQLLAFVLLRSPLLLLRKDK